LGNLDAQRDWGHARDYVEGMWKILQHTSPDDFVLATGTTTSVRDFCRMAFQTLGVELSFEGSGVEECGRVAGVSSTEYGFQVGQEVIRIDPRYFRPAEVDLLVGDASKAKAILGWEPTHSLQELVQEMIRTDLQLFHRERFLRDGGFEILGQHE
jgi:GDPmannose 4,6-dehydratase